MSVQVTCQYTGIEFTAATKRSKNHPTISGWLQEANREGWYQQATAALTAGREAGYETIAEFVSLLKETEAAAKAQQEVDYAKRITEYRQRKAEASARLHNLGEYTRRNADDIETNLRDSEIVNNPSSHFRPGPAEY